MSARAQLALFEGARLSLDESIELTVASLHAYGPRYRHWGMAWSGGKDSTATLTLLVHLLRTGRIPAPERLTVLYTDTRLELLPLWLASNEIRAQIVALTDDIQRMGVSLDVRVVLPDMDKRFLVYVLGRGVPPANNNTLRWCTRQTKLDPMQAEIGRMLDGAEEPVLMLTGVRQGESAIRDQRIVMSCGRDGAECGQGWFQVALDGRGCDTLAPILHFRVCHVWDWLRIFAPDPGFGGWSTALLAEAYGGDEAQEKNARTGCVGCPLAEKDTALDGLLGMPQWAYLHPLKELRPLWRELRKPRHRLRMPAGERRKDGSLTANQHRMGPILLESREWALGRVLDIQTRCNMGADEGGRPHVDILNREEEARVRELIAANTWPRKWSGEEPTADTPFFESGDLFGLEEAGA